jgi:ABC-type amino acid transport substrate-binding protein
MQEKNTYSNPRVVVLLAVVLAIVAAAITSWALRAKGGQVQSATASDLESIIKRGSIRCGYVSNPPSCIIDPNTKKVSGIVADAIETVAKAAGLRVEWTEEVGFGSMVEGLRANRYDVVPCAIWPTAARAREADFTRALFYSGVSAYVRPDDSRFLNKPYPVINSPQIKVATIDGELAETIAKTDFPKAQRVGQPQISEITTMLLNVKEKKADVAFVESYFAYEFLQKNPGSVKNMVPGQPIRIFPNTIILRRGQLELKAFLDTALTEQLNLGAIDRLVDQYEPERGIFYRVARPYVPETAK